MKVHDRANDTVGTLLWSLKTPKRSQVTAETGSDGLECSGEEEEEAEKTEEEDIILLDVVQPPTVSKTATTNYRPRLGAKGYDVWSSNCAICGEIFVDQCRVHLSRNYRLAHPACICDEGE
jgi:hypothetical protein